MAASPDFYATGAQVIPILLFTLVFEMRFTASALPPSWERDARKKAHEESRLRAKMDEDSTSVDEADLRAISKSLARIRRRIRWWTRFLTGYVLAILTFAFFAEVVAIQALRTGKPSAAAEEVIVWAIFLLVAAIIGGLIARIDTTSAGEGD